MNADGSGQTNLTNNAFNDRDPAWSPTAPRSPSTSNRDGDYEIYVMNADGSGQTNLTNNTYSDFGPAWSPDGAKIAYEAGGAGRGNAEVNVMNADGSGQTNLTNSPNVRPSSRLVPERRQDRLRDSTHGQL